MNLRKHYNEKILSVKFSYPMKVFEYFSRGKPVIATRIESLESLSPLVSLVSTSEMITELISDKFWKKGAYPLLIAPINVLRSSAVSNDTDQFAGISTPECCEKRYALRRPHRSFPAASQLHQLVQQSVPLLPKAKAILDNYKEVGEYALPKFSNQKINSYLKEIVGILGIKKL